MEKTARKIINRSEDGVREVASSGEASEVDVKQNQSRQIQAITEQGHDIKTQQERKTGIFDCDSNG